MRSLLSGILLSIAIGCTTYSSEDLNGKWLSRIDGDILELWLSDTLAIGFNIDNQLMNTYRVDYNKKTLSFKFIDHMNSSAPWNVRVLNFSDSSFQTELQYPGKKRIATYLRIAERTPEISTNHEINWERYKDYMRSRLDSL